MTDNETFYFNINDHKFDLNVIIDWENFKFMSLTFHYLKIKIKMMLSDLFFFLRQNFIYDAVNVIKIKSMINCFIHDEMIVWEKKRKNYAHESFRLTKANLKKKIHRKFPELLKWRVFIKSKISKWRGSASETQFKLSEKFKAKSDVSDFEEESELNSNSDKDDEKDTLSLNSENEVTIFTQNCIVYQEASFNSDADWIVYYFINSENSFHLFNSDCIITLITLFISNLIKSVSFSKLKISIVQTVYVNSISTEYITHYLKLPVVCINTGVKHLHHIMIKFDISVYFEVNDHSIIFFFDSVLKCLCKHKP